MPLHEDESKLSAWLDGELSPEAARAVEAHVNECERCRELVVSFEHIQASVASSRLVEPDPDPGFLVRFRARRDAVSVAPFWTWRQLAMRLVPVALVVLVAALGSVWIASRHGPVTGPAPDLTTLEREAIGNPTVFARTAPEPVLEIALEPFPGEVP